MNMTTASMIDPGEEMRPLPRPRPLSSLVAAATRLTKQTITRPGYSGTAPGMAGWQGDAWEMYDLVGEERFLASTLANRLGQARLYVGHVDSSLDEPEPVEDGLPSDVFKSFAPSPAALSQIVTRLGVNLFIAGDGWLVGIPSNLLEGITPDDEPLDISPVGADELGEAGLDVDDLEWRTMSVDEIKRDRDNNLEIALGAGKDNVLTCGLDDVWLIRVWRPHPRRWWEADSPTKASLPVLRELVGLTMHISAQIDSRLAGAGVFLVPQKASDSVKRQAGLAENEGTDDDPFMDAMIEGMITPISDRSSAAAYVPLTFTVPGETIEQFRHISFASPLDAEARQLRDEAIRRLALGQDAPPELLLGVAGMNHWGAWLVREDVVTTHLEPPLALVCDALTTQFLWPVLAQQGMEPGEYRQYAIWYDVSHMVSRPNRATDSLNLYDRDELSAKALRSAHGFDESDAPEIVEVDSAVERVLDMVKAAPSLAQAPGLDELLRQVRALYGEDADEDTDTTTTPATPAEEGAGDAPTTGEDGDSRPEPEEGDIPSTEGDDAPTGDDMTASAGLQAAQPRTARLIRATSTLGRVAEVEEADEVDDTDEEGEVDSE